MLLYIVFSYIIYDILGEKSIKIVIDQNNKVNLENLSDLNLAVSVDNKNLVEVYQRSKVLENSKSGKIKNTKFHKFLSDEVKGKINMSEKLLERICTCGDFLQFLGDQGLEHIKLENANFCGHRFCPQCSANKSREDALQIATLVKYLREVYNYEFLFLTLTAPNVPAEMVADELAEYSKSFEKLFKNKKIKAISKGYIRKLEMTYNHELDTYHPHYHIMIAVSKSYFTQTTQYISQQERLKLWRKAKRDDSITQVDVRKFKSQNDEFKAIFELSKYISKDSDYMHNSDVFAVFYKTLKGKRMLSFSGCFKDAVTLYKNGDLEEYMGKDPNAEIEYIYRVWYQWDRESSTYKDVKKVDLTPDEKEKANLTRAEKAQKQKDLRNEIAELNSKESAIREEELSNSRASRTKTKDFTTGEMLFDDGEEKFISTKLGQEKFDKVVEKFNDKYEGGIDWSNLNKKIK